MPYNAATAVSFAQGKSGRYRDGECWTLVEDAVVGAGGVSSRSLTPNFSASSAYVWGNVVQVNAIQAGDVLQFRNYSWEQSITTDITNPDGSGSTNTRLQQETRGAPNHSALVVRSLGSGMVEVIEQNIPSGSGPVQTVQLLLSARAPTTVTTRTPGSGGEVVTITSTTHVVRNPPTVYRPRAA